MSFNYGMTLISGQLLLRGMEIVMEIRRKSQYKNNLLPFHESQGHLAIILRNGYIHPWFSFSLWIISIFHPEWTFWLKSFRAIYTWLIMRIEPHWDQIIEQKHWLFGFIFSIAFRLKFHRWLWIHREIWIEIFPEAHLFRVGRRNSILR